MPVKSTRRMMESLDPLKEKVEKVGCLLLDWSQTRDLLAGTESPKETEDEGDTDTKETEAGSGSGNAADAQYDSPQYYPDEGETGEARKFWNKLPADTRRELAHQELGNLETNKQFQLYLQAQSNYDNCLTLYT